MRFQAGGKFLMAFDDKLRWRSFSRCHANGVTGLKSKLSSSSIHNITQFTGLIKIYICIFFFYQNHKLVRVYQLQFDRLR